MGLDLIYDRNLITVFYQMFKMSFHEIAHSNISDFSFLFKLN